jgi:chromosome segregation ATPase
MTIQYQPDLFDDEWDKMAHTPDEYRREIRQLRERCYNYAKELEGLRADLEALSSEMERMERQR